MDHVPTLYDILDSYLNTGDYDDYLDGWVECRPDGSAGFDIIFTDEASGTTTKYRLREVD